ncbi:TIGR00730 family Rossman fold protein [Streptomyces sp. NPDC048710]|uniref:LOG family protein n=1 Tax=unclassified Streptomyces TaxID=2593676 RepID=UPI003715F39A
MQRITVFCGASEGARPEYATEAATLGRTLAMAGIGVVYGGASTGLMGIVADSALAHGGEVIGVIPRDLVAHEVAHQGLTAQYVVDSMHERKALMAKLGDGFVSLPGGMGTAEEFFEVVTWAQLGFHDKPCALVNTYGFYEPLLGFLRHAADEGFVHRRYLDNISVAAHATDVLELLRMHQPLPHLFAPGS